MREGGQGGSDDEYQCTSTTPPNHFMEGGGGCAFQIGKPETLNPKLTRPAQGESHPPFDEASLIAVDPRVEAIS